MLKKLSLRKTGLGKKYSIKTSRIVKLLLMISSRREENNCIKKCYFLLITFLIIEY